MMVMIITTMFVLDIGFLETKFAPNAGRKKNNCKTNDHWSSSQVIGKKITDKQNSY